MTLSRIFLATLLVPLLTSPAQACDLDDCALPRMSHSVEVFDIEETEAPRTDLTLPQWRWIPHDLALARTALTDGDNAQAIVLLRGVDGAMRAQIDAALTAKVRSEIQELHQVVSALMLRAGGTPVAELPSPPESQLPADDSTAKGAQDSQPKRG